MKIFIKLVLVSILSVSAGESFSQNTFEKTYGGNGIEKGTVFCPTSDSGFIICATHSGTVSGSGLWLLLADHNGDTLWTKSFLQGNNSIGHVVFQNMDGGFTIAGDNGVAFIMRTDPNGDSLWIKFYPGAGFSDGCQTSDQKFILVNEIKYGFPDIFKLDEYGDTIWTKTLLKEFEGIQYSCSAASVIEINPGDFIIGGYADGELAGPPGFSFITKTDALGDTVWFRILNPDYLNDPFYITDLARTQDNGIIIVGTDWEDIKLMKADTSGSIIWQKVYSFSQHPNYFDVSEGDISISATSDGGYVLSAPMTILDLPSYDQHKYVRMLRLNETGDTIWTMKHLSKNQIDRTGIFETPDHGYATVGHTMEDPDNPDVWLVKVDETGHVTSVKEESSDQGKHPEILLSNYPNPFVSSTLIRFSLPGPGEVSLTITDLQSREVAGLLEDLLPGGEFTINYKTDLNPGIYLLILRTKNNIKSSRLIIGN